MSDKKLGRRAAGCWGRPGSSRQKRAASKASRRNGKRQGRTIGETICQARESICRAREKSGDD